MRRLIYESVTEDDLRRLAAAVGQLAEAINRQLHSDVAKIVEQWDREWAGEPTDAKIQEELFDDYQFDLDWETALAWRDQLKFLAQRLRSLEPEPEPMLEAEDDHD